MINDLSNFGFGTQIRKSPFYDATVRWGAKGFSTYNHMYIPRDFGNPEENFWNLVNDAILCDVAVERQVQIKGLDASKFVQMMTPRDLSNMQVGQCKYVILTNQDGGILNDPVLLKVDENCYWFSLADSGVLFWAQGLSVNSDYDVDISEPDVSPLQLQGPKSRDIAIKLFGDSIVDLKYFWFKRFRLDDINLLVSRTGWSSELGYEIFLLDSSQGDELYERIMQTGKSMGLKPGHTSTIRRVEGGMLSYHADMDINTNPIELGMDRLIDLDKDFNFIGKTALETISKNGVSQKHIGIEIFCDPMNGPNTKFWNILNNEAKVIGKVTSAVYSPRLKKNIALAMILTEYSLIGTEIIIDQGSNKSNAIVVDKPFYDPNKALAKS